MFYFKYKLVLSAFDIKIQTAKHEFHQQSSKQLLPFLIRFEFKYLMIEYLTIMFLLFMKLLLLLQAQKLMHIVFGKGILFLCFTVL